MEFKIARLTYERYQSQAFAVVTVQVDAKFWHKARAKNDLGYLYGVAISNAVAHADPAIYAYCPTVSDRAKAKGGIKTIQLTYPMQERPTERKVYKLHLVREST